MKLSIFLGALVVVNMASAKPFDLTKSPDVTKQNFNQGSQSILTETFDFSGIAALSGCSGSIVNLGVDESAKAIMMTNGHCLDMMDDEADAVIFNEPYVRNIKAFKNIRESVTVRSIRILYGIMQPHDVALVELNVTYKELLGRGIKSFRLSPMPAPVGEPLIFASGLFQEISQCPLEAVIYRLKEDKWINENVLKYTKCDSKHGTSGTPLISALTNEIVGINMTGNDNGGKCTFNNPCEIDENGVITVSPHAGYGDQIYKLLNCLDTQNNFDLFSPACVLPKPKSN
jgi:hypothetical protein